MPTPATLVDPKELALLNEFQRGFPLVARPFATLATRLSSSEDWVRERLGARIQDGTVSRVGAVFAPGAIGVSTLAALALPPERLAAVAALVSAHPEVNHNYERDHERNLWFVATAPDAAALDACLAAIGREAGQVPLTLPLVREYWIDLGFDLETQEKRAAHMTPPRDLAGWRPDARERALIAQLERGLPIVSRPWRALAAAAGWDEAVAIARLRDWLAQGVIKRIGIIVRHRMLGYRANAMCVWDVPDAIVDRVGDALAHECAITLCYRRVRGPGWPYNLFAMLHGRDRDSVRAVRDDLAALHGLNRFPSATLFSTRAFKQRGARYFASRDAPAAAPFPRPALPAAAGHAAGVGTG